MATPALVVLVVGLVGSLLVIVVVVVVVVQRVSRSYQEAARALERLQPVLGRIAEHQVVTRRELDRVGDAVEQLRSDREARRPDGRPSVH